MSDKSKKTPTTGYSYSISWPPGHGEVSALNRIADALERLIDLWQQDNDPDADDPGPTNVGIPLPPGYKGMR